MITLDTLKRLQFCFSRFCSFCFPQVFGDVTAGVCLPPVQLRLIVE